jgi:hypothetical protein
MQSILSLRGWMGCFAEPVIGAQSRDPLARNDGRGLQTILRRRSAPA